MNDKNENEDEIINNTDQGAKSEEDVRSQQTKDAKHTETEEATETDDVEFEELDEDGEVSAKNTIKKLREKLKKAEGEKREYLLGWQRSQADYANLKKETESRRSADIKLANKRLIEDILPVLDAYTMARGNTVAWEKVESNWRIGIEYIFNQLNSVLENNNLKSFGNIGEKFDPSLHESIEIIKTDDDKKNDTIESVMTKGYKLGDSILRPAKVKVYHLD